MNPYETLLKELPRIAEAVKNFPADLRGRAFDALIETLTDVPPQWNQGLVRDENGTVVMDVGRARTPEQQRELDFRMDQFGHTDDASAGGTPQPDDA